MGVCIDKLPHTCGTKKGLQVFADTEKGTVNGWCYSCQTFVANPYGSEKKIEDVEIPEPKTEAEIQAEMAEISSYPTVDVAARKLRGRYLENFGIKTSLSEEDGKTPTALFYPVTIKGKHSGYYIKTLTDPSHQWAVGEVKGGEPIGWREARESGAYKLIITEGREDMVATEAIFDLFGKEEYKPAVISLLNGTNSVDGCLSQIAEEASSKFKEILLVFDDDKAGNLALEKAMLIFPQAKTASLPKGDPNDCLKAGPKVAKAAFNAMSFHASKPKNTRLIVSGGELHEKARKPTPMGELTWPYATMNKLLRNLRYGETIYIGGGVKMGKSELVNDIGAHLIENHGIPILMAKPEEENEVTYKMVCNKIAQTVFTDPDREFNFDKYDAAGEVIGDKLVLLDLFQHIGWESLKKDIVYAVKTLGVKAVFIDPITNLTNGINAAEANTKLQEIAQDLSAMARDLNIVVFIFCHLKAPEGTISNDAREKKYRAGQYTQLGNCPHEFGGTIMSPQFAGSRAMMRSCNLMLGLEGNKDPDLDEEVRNMRWITILEDRGFGNSARIPLYWNKHTTKFTEV